MHPAYYHLSLLCKGVTTYILHIMIPVVNIVKNECVISHYDLVMGFWQKVDDELLYLGKSRKALALEVGFDVSYISKGIERNGIPIADTAVKIANALNVSLEYLLDMEKNTESKSGTEEFRKKDMALYRKYEKNIEQLEKLNQKERHLILQLLETLAQR